MKQAAQGLPVALLASTIVLLLAPAATAGGDFVDLAVGSTRVWFVGEPGVREFDARTGRTLASPRLVGAPYPLSVALAGGAAWVASVENGYVWGTLTRIDIHTGRTRVLWRKPDSAVQYVAAGAGGVWALIGSAGTTRIARFSLSGRLSHSWTIPGAGQDGGRRERLLDLCRPLAAPHRRRRARPSRTPGSTRGRQHRLGRSLAAASGDVVRVDERSGPIRTLHTGRLRLGGFQHDLAAGDGALWALNDTGRSHTTLERLNLQSGARTGRVRVPGIADALVVKPNALWVATVIAPPNRPASGYDIIRLDRQTLQRTLLVHVA
jgi:hypothetical protein